MARPQLLAFGAGVDSTAILAMALWPDAAARVLGRDAAAIRAAVPRFDAVVFANPGAEFPDTYRNVVIAEHACRDAGVAFAVTAHPTETITDWCLRLGVVPVMPGGRHVCSRKFKGDVLDRWARDHFDTPPVWAIGIDAGEGRRCQRFTPPKGDESGYRYPLRDLGLGRDDCERLLAALWPVAVRKSSCVFCPFMSLPEIEDMAQNHPEQWALAKRIEANFAATSARKHRAWLDAGRPRTGPTGTGPAPRGMWSRDSWAEGARLFAKAIDGKRLSIEEWERRLRSVNSAPGSPTPGAGGTADRAAVSQPSLFNSAAELLAAAADARSPAPGSRHAPTSAWPRRWTAHARPP